MSRSAIPILFKRLTITGRKSWLKVVRVISERTIMTELPFLKKSLKGVRAVGESRIVFIKALGFERGAG